MELRERVEAVVGQRVVALDDIPGAGGYTPALRRIAALADGSTVFVKAAVDDLTRWWLSIEHRSYAALDGATFVPRYLGGDDVVLVLEDLRVGHWPPAWRPGDVDRVLEVLDAVARHTPPDDARTLESATPELPGFWEEVAADPEPLLALGACTREWFDGSIDTILEVAASGTLAGDALVHYDVRSDNLCLFDDRVLLVDWNNTLRGRADFDVHCFAQTLEFEGGPTPDEVLPDADPALVTLIAGYFARNATQPPIPTAPHVRRVQRQQLGVCIPWMGRLLGL
jgi:hypothetical protein